MANQNRDDEGRFASAGVLGSLRDRPFTSAAIAAGAAAAGAFLWSRRAQIGEQAGHLGSRLSEQYDRLNERRSAGADPETTGLDPASAAKAKRMSAARDGRKSQSQIAEEALSLKQSGEDDQTTAQSQQTKVGSIAY